MSKGPHPDTMIGSKGVRTLRDGCDTCMFSKVYCDAVKHLDNGQPCCDSCTHS